MAWQLPAHLDTYAARIPAATRAALQAHELLARCEYAAHLERTAAGITDGTTARSFYDLADQVLRAMTCEQLEADLKVLNDGLASASPSLVGGYSKAADELKARNPQPPDEFVKRARGAVAVDGGGPAPVTPSPST